ncbi:SDR family NAD(P)-dependent oxidoreductase [Agrobacterium tumefaciens]|uniref:SDR family NAD(P)-dependent oxidoreductase n=1 Tax=Agrobacterium TaxID=357 RepID=UPI00080F8ADA|nr:MULTISPECIES: SDR family NAD(P)-dependent oxidoreductase [Agrobacterium]MCZ7501552.1 SDR family NAD(P)-dependent oxidoreductase [Rhizobium rhizogenes]NSZ04488.1 SDR family NAD(P)-dependent oxidoreductase [Agrobacterium tumefaciens]NSZ36700.1 SDR family NAD(P)-dependent oxidoreductase [Agrobacterium tumefaciens]NTB25501.1 SDR family NAD(P)-dependent oxidoreductase [Agrobacterium tumefaciens]NTB27156.1 SDR family NAD(P)-dependent oxidoreductase [Agrobacterium tumefaciens]
MPAEKSIKGLAVVTGASSGIGYELARCAARDGYNLIIVADEAEIETAATQLRAAGTEVEAVQADLSTQAGVEKLLSRIATKEWPVDLLFANAGQGLGNGFLDQKMDAVQRVIATNISGTVALVHAIGSGMRQRGSGRILLTGSIAGFMPGTFQAVYNATKAFINSFSFALREELDGTGVTVTCLMPGATETAFFERADMLDTAVGKQKKDDPGFVAQIGYDAMMNGDGDVVSGWKNKLISAAANVTPSDILAKQHRKMAAREGK